MFLEDRRPLTTMLKAWETLLRNIDLMTVSARSTGRLLRLMEYFSLEEPRKDSCRNPAFALFAFTGTEPDYATRTDEDLRGPIVPLRASNGEIMSNPVVVDQAWDFVRRNTTPTAHHRRAHGKFKAGNTRKV